MNKKYDDIKIPNNIDSIIEDGAKKASILKRKKSRKRGMSIAAALAVFMMVGVTSKPALAGDIPILSEIYRGLGFTSEYLPVTQYIGKSVEKKGIKVTVENIAGTRHKIKMTVKIESDEEIFQSKTFNNIHMRGEVNGVGVAQGGGMYFPDNKTQVSVIDFVSEEGFDALGEIKLHIFSEEYNLEEELKFKVDFTASFENNYRKNITTDTYQKDNRVVGIESTGIGTVLEVENLVWNTDDILLKVDDRIYRPNSLLGDEETAYISYDEALKNEVENAKEIFVIIRKDVMDPGVEIKSEPEPTEEEKRIQEQMIIEENIRHDEHVRIYNEEYSKLLKSNRDSILYVPEITSKAGGKVYLSSIERNNDKVVVEINGENKADTLSVAINMYLDYEDDSLYEGRMILRETNTGYVLEYDKVKDENVVLRAGNILLGDSVVTEEVKLILK